MADQPPKGTPAQMGRPPYEPTEKDRSQVRVLAGMGVPEYDIATVMQISPPTLRKYFQSELARGHIEANAKVAESLFKQATDQTRPNVTAAIFWLKCRAGWMEYEQSPPKGKKESADEAAQTAQAGTGWDDLLHPIRPSTDQIQ